MLMRWYSPGMSMLDGPLLGSSLVDDVFGNFFNATRSVAAGPRFVTKEESEGHVLSAEVPGLSRDELQITVDKGVLTVAGRREMEIPEGYQVLRRERVPVSFSKSFRLSDDMDGSKIDARLESGLLTIHIPRRPEAQPRQIEIK